MLAVIANAVKPKTKLTKAQKNMAKIAPAMQALAKRWVDGGNPKTNAENTLGSKRKATGYVDLFFDENYVALTRIADLPLPRATPRSSA